MKIAGAVLLAGASLMCGLAAYRTLSCRVSDLKSLIDALGVLRSEIVCRLAPLEEAAAAVGAACDCEFAKTLTEQCKYQAFSGAFEAALETLRADERAVLLPLLPVLGRYGEADQSAALDRATERLERLLGVAESERSRSGKVYITLGLCGGMALSIVLL